MSESADSKTIGTIASLMRAAKSVLFITGAGVSAESGVSTYRGIGGLYNVETTQERYEIEEVLSSSMLA